MFSEGEGESRSIERLRSKGWSYSVSLKDTSWMGWNVSYSCWMQSNGFGGDLEKGWFKLQETVEGQLAT